MPKNRSRPLRRVVIQAIHNDVVSAPLRLANDKHHNDPHVRPLIRTSKTCELKQFNIPASLKLRLSHFFANSNSMLQATSVPGVLASFTETWSPRLVAAINDHHIKVAKIDGEFIWHSHPDSEEVFYLLAGKLKMEIEGQDTVVMNEGDMLVIPKGVRHQPVAEKATIMMIEHESTVNTGDQTDSERTKQVQDARMDR